MKEQKTRTRPEEHSKNKGNSWKNKSKAQSQELKFLRQRTKELALSRDLWKNKYYQSHSSRLSLEALDDGKARYHQYELWSDRRCGDIIAGIVMVQRVYVLAAITC
ncbi:MAG: hypothetical protein EAZ70_06815 [Runella slithyformis]|nr:MAG: hypothetical protein EAY79_04550 [Runella slithyformis]TAF96699.1 MAG: hypothetical protein EAZ46_04190 [Runella sp.]TAG21087.1 MAG: hypothetical protein EAZ38_08785 [Cytophagales bacterium]TAG40173.1 MAG: hypothetical protein EAZ32_07260 [Cytophagia bacterium]TAF27590.1 MAG: hypothetical protein EAZ70_06815 [Runella slithyformis]